MPTASSAAKTELRPRKRGTAPADVPGPPAGQGGAAHTGLTPTNLNLLLHKLHEHQQQHQRVPGLTPLYGQPVAPQDSDASPSRVSVDSAMDPEAYAYARVGLPAPGADKKADTGVATAAVQAAGAQAPSTADDSADDDEWVSGRTAATVRRVLTFDDDDEGGAGEAAVRPTAAAVGPALMHDGRGLLGALLRRPDNTNRDAPSEGAHPERDDWSSDSTGVEQGSPLPPYARHGAAAFAGVAAR